MKARVTLTVHGVNILTPEQLGALAARITELFGCMVALSRHDMICSFVTDDHQAAFKRIEAFNLELARQFSPGLWTSIASEDIPQP